MKKREFLKLLSAASLIGAMPHLACAQTPALGTNPAQTNPAMTAKRPNILFVITDDQSWVHTGFNGDPAVKTPNFDRIAREGINFTNAYVSAPTCTPSRGAILTGQDFSRLEEGGNLLSSLPAKLPVYPDLLEQSGYAVGYARKGWDPGYFPAGGRTRNPAGPKFEDFATFRASVAPNQPFSFWFGPHEPHRPYKPDAREEFPVDPAKVAVPAFLPDVPEVRADIADYLAAIERADHDLGVILDELEKRGELDNTLIVVTSDNGMPFPRAKMNLYDYGTRMPLAVRWPAGGVKGGRTVTDFVNLIDFAPTFLQVAGVKVPDEMTGKNLLPVLQSEQSGRVDTTRDRVYVGRERHDIFRKDPETGNFLGYPMRAVRTDDYLYIRNFHPERVPAADAPKVSDSDWGATKDYFHDHANEAAVAPLHRLAYGLRPPEEFYDVKKDPFQMHNLAADANYAASKQRLSADLDAWMKRIADPRAGTLEEGDVFDRYPPRFKPKPKAEGAAPPTP